MKDSIPIWKAENNNGRLRIFEIDKFNEYVNKLRGDLEVIVRKFEKPGSDPQRGYYWKCIVRVLARTWGWDETSLHVRLKAKFACWMDDKGKWNIVDYSQMSTVQREEYQEKIRVWALTEHGIRLALPNETE